MQYWMWKLFLSGDIPLSVVHAVLQQSVTDWVGGRGVPVEVPFISRDQVKEQLVAHMEHVVQLQRMDSLNPVAGAPMVRARNDAFFFEIRDIFMRYLFPSL